MHSSWGRQKSSRDPFERMIMPITKLARGAIIPAWGRLSPGRAKLKATFLLWNGRWQGAHLCCKWKRNSITWAQKASAWKWMSLGSGMHSLLREEAFVLESMWFKYHRAKWPICLALSNYQTKVKIWNGKHRNEACLGLELDVGPRPQMKCGFPHSSFSIPPQCSHLHQKNKINSSWKIIYSGKVESGKQDKQPIWKILTQGKMLFPSWQKRALLAELSQ